MLIESIVNKRYKKLLSVVSVVVQFSSVRFSLSVVSNSSEPHESQLTSWSITNSQSLPKVMSIESVMQSSHLILCHPLLLLPPITRSIRVFSNESILCMRWPKYWSFSLSISPSNEHSGLISFKVDWLYLLALQGILKSLHQHPSSKTSIFWHSVFFTFQLSHPYMTTGKTITSTRWTFVDKVTSLLFNMLSRLVITFFPRSRCLLMTICSDFGAPQNKDSRCFHCFRIYSHEVMGLDAMILVF